MGKSCLREKCPEIDANRENGIFNLQSMFLYVKVSVLSRSVNTHFDFFSGITCKSRPRVSSAYLHGSDLQLLKKVAAQHLLHRFPLRVFGVG